MLGAEDLDNQYHRVGIDRFVHGRDINHNIFIRLSNKKYVKIGNKGEDIGIDRIGAFKIKGVHFLYLRKDDFKKFVEDEGKK